jgi:hypothetical protein
MVKQDVLAALARLARDSDFSDIFVDEIKRRREEERDGFESAGTPILAGRRQGASRFATDLLTLIQEATALARRR